MSEVSVDFGVDVHASCRDCGATIPNALEHVRGAARVDHADASEQGAVVVDSPGACGACGGGRVAVRTSFSVE